MDIGTALRRARGRAGLTQRALADLTGVAQPTIARIERGREEPRVGTLEVLLSACGHRLEITRRGGEGIDRTAIRELLALTPAERADLAIRDARALDDIPRGGLISRRPPSAPA
jgi:transcriptional regulator with XRE-family HTH domain